MSVKKALIVLLVLVLTACSHQNRLEVVRKITSDFSYQFNLWKKAKLENGSYVFEDENYKVFFTVKPELQETLERLLKRFKVKYGAVVLMSPDGKILALASSLEYPNLVFKNTFPCASTFKLITASAGLESGLLKKNTVLCCGGVEDSCSPTVWLKSKLWLKRDFTSSFSLSANPFFGNVARLIGREELLETARKFGFNSKAYNFPWGIVRNPLDDNELALLGAGLGISRTSPLHLGLIVSTFLNNGTMPKPFLIEKVEDKNGKVLWEFTKSSFGKVVSSETSKIIKDLMIETVKSGTASTKKYFKILKRRFPNVLVGGKTGTLSELTYPEGRCEWFAGFFTFKGKTFVIVSLAVNNSVYYISGQDLGAVSIMEIVKRLNQQVVDSDRNQPCDYEFHAY